jgi:FtsP/CotA-like multicopper oxidase with cupredoxin domain
MENHMMEESTTIHWHGHHQRGTPYMDGVPYVTQCPIPPKTSFRYHYIADTPGTHFWHSHSGMYTAVMFCKEPINKVSFIYYAPNVSGSGAVTPHTFFFILTVYA